MNAGREGVSLYAENAVLFATFDANPRSACATQKYFEGFLAARARGRVGEATLVHTNLADGVYLATGLFVFYEEGDACSTRLFYFHRFG